MRKSWRNKFLVLALSILVLACGKKHNANAGEEYTCPMHPSVVQHAPGTCPICGMDLVRRGAGGSDSVKDDVSSILKPTNARVVSSIRTVVPVRKNLATAFSARGEIVHNTQTLGSISAAVSGRIEELFIRSNFQPITRGQPILRLYSPELIVAEEEFVRLLNSEPANSSLLESAKTRLVLLGLSDDQVNKLVETKRVSHTVTLYSPVSGYVTTHEEGDNGTENNVMQRVRTGMYLDKGQEIFTIVSHRDLWAEFTIYPRDVATINLGDSAVVTVDDTYGTMIATVDRIQPSFNDPSGLVKVRMRLVNPHHRYHAGQFVTARFSHHADSTLWIPKSSQLDMGINHVVFLKRKNIFKPTRIATGVIETEWVQVVDGLKWYDSIAYNASFLVDNEDFIKSN